MAKKKSTRFEKGTMDHDGDGKPGGSKPKAAQYVVTRDRLLLGPRVYVRDEVVTVGDEVDAKTAAQYVENGWLADA